MARLMKVFLMTCISASDTPEARAQFLEMFDLHAGIIGNEEERANFSASPECRRQWWLFRVS